MHDMGLVSPSDSPRSTSCLFQNVCQDKLNSIIFVQVLKKLFAQRQIFAQVLD
ncbi:unnamed protein product [Ectocarpus sp. 6 AP-2014]